ncbi:MAG: alpha-glucan family phosphorylase [Bacteroidales bacterium]|nr:alpha-glucan family phosphorylase [Bacteroidales bacterium]
MTDTKIIKPDYIFETSWEICNKIGGIYTVISTKALSIVKEYSDNYILIGPDVWKETRENPDFIEDRSLYKSWKEKAENNGLHIRIGRWNIAGKPIVVLVDFTPYFSEKDKIFAYFWETYKLDSISGQWDYIEPALFGYAAGKVIESFYEFYLSAQDRIIAQFHEWMTGTGVLYLKANVPQIGCVFTTHATILGRSIAGNGLPLYSNLNFLNNDEKAKEFGIVSKYSLEKLSALESDIFTTVSQNTAIECKKFLNRDVDVITENGFEDSFVPIKKIFPKKRVSARKKLFEVAEALLNQKISKDSLLIINSGRYEFKNKGIDLFIDALGEINRQNKLKKNIIAFITIPAHQSGPDKNVFKRIDNCDYKNPLSDKYLTHVLYEKKSDRILNRIKKNDLKNLPDNKVKIIFVPAYLNGNDGIFNITYYDLLIGFDISVFPSYYEPWGYTPLESIAFHIPTITTSLAGFGKYVQSEYGQTNKGVIIINRNDDNDNEVVAQIVNDLIKYNNLTNEEIEAARKEAFDISRIALWENLIIKYKKAFSYALEKTEKRADLYKNKLAFSVLTGYKNGEINKPTWKKILVKPNIPKSLKALQKLSKNLWWTWNCDAIELFQMIDEKLWIKFNQNPIALLESLTYKQLQDIENNNEFIQKLQGVYTEFEQYMKKTSEKPSDIIAYFSMEYGLHDTIKIFSGGLGVLAGDYLKEASDSNINIIGIGLLYRYGYFQQSLSLFGDQLSSYTPQKFTHLPILPVRDKNNNWIKISIPFPGRTLFANVWRVDVGRIPLYLLDTDIEKNSLQDKTITHQLYGGNIENRLKQELLLGIGGIELLDAINIKPNIYHCNEGHSAFIGLERLRNLIQYEKLSFDQALEVIRSTTLFTTHTPVPAGHDSFSEDLLRTYIPHYANFLNLSWESLMNLGRFTDNKKDENFSMSVLAAKLSQEINGVSQIHGKVTREMFSKLYNGYFPDELHISYVTNGVHYKTWTDKNWQQLHKNEFGDEFIQDQSNEKYWNKINNVQDKTIWNLRKKIKHNLVEFLKNRLTQDMTMRQENPKIIFKTIEAINENALIIGFARRFATYKRAHLLFSNPERLARIVNDKNKPVQLIFSGKAHPNDKAGQDLIKKIIEISKNPEFIGKIFFIENYNIEIAKKLISGCDIWLNTPTRPLEASGTSGEKAIMNGVINFSVLDGWWAEAYRKNAGWAIKEVRTYANQQFQDELDAETIYNLLEEEIIPLFYDIDNDDVPHKWISYIKNTFSDIAPHYTMKRMLDDYRQKYYSRLIKRSSDICSKDYEMARQIAAWKRKLVREWDNIEIISIDIPDSSKKPLMLGKNFKAEIKLNLNGLSENDIGIEILFGRKENDEVKKIIYLEELKITGIDNNIVKFNCDIPATKAGVYDYAFRIFPKAPFLPHRQDFNLIKWI